MQHRQKHDSLQTRNRDSSPAEPIGAAQDNRVGATLRMWSVAVLMLISCVAGNLGHAENAIWAIVVGAAVGTAAVWGMFNNRKAHRLPAAETLKALNQRLADVETIVSYEEKVAEAKNRRLELSTEPVDSMRLPQSTE